MKSGVRARIMSLKLENGLGFMGKRNSNRMSTIVCVHSRAGACACACLIAPEHFHPVYVISIHIKEPGEV